MLTGNLTLKEKIAEANKVLESLKQEFKATVVGFALPKLGKNIRVELGEKNGNIVIYGLQRMPYCFYLNQAVKMQQILNSPEFATFIAENEGKFSVLPAKAE